MFRSLKTLLGRSIGIAGLILAALPLWAGQLDAAEHRADLSHLVVIGDSLSAGFQNFSLYDSDSVMPPAPPGGQRHGFAALIAQQANVDLSLPLIQYPGFPPVLTLEGGVVSRASGVGTRELQTVSVQTHNLSVPGFDVLDALVHKVNLPNLVNNPQSASFEDVLAVQILDPALLLGSPPSGCGVIPRPNGDILFSQALCAIELRPTTILISIGNGDALQSVTLGIAPTDTTKFAKYYELLLYALSHYTKANIVVSNIPDVAGLPFLVSYPEFEAKCGGPPLNAGPNDYVVPDLTAPVFNLCTNYSVRPASLIAQAETAVRDYNVIIAGAAAKFGAVVVDVNTLFAGIAKNGYDVAGHHLTNQYLGGIFSLDAVHPTNTGYAILANAFIDRMNCEFHTNLPPVNIEQIAVADPLVCAVGSPDPSCPTP
ncbi:MAG: SGNH/GDSL hydrolase family protein [Bryobacteraceae bacterium]